VSANGSGVDPCAVKVERMREALLDLTNRNQLLNFRHSERSRSHIRVIDEIPEVLFERLVAGTRLRFKAFERKEPDTDKTRSGASLAKATQSARDDLAEQKTPAADVTWQEVAASLGMDISFELPLRSAAPPARHTDNAIQVPHFGDVAERKLDGIRQTYRTLLEEMGIPALFGAFGFLEWYETPTDPKPLLAPLTLLPLEIDRSRSGYKYEYRVAANDDEAQSNLSLQQRLKRFGVDLPSIADVGSVSFLTDYLGLVEQRIRHLPRWRVRRYVTIGIFHFARQVMYQDLDPAKWVQQGGLGSHEPLRVVLGLGVGAPRSARPVDSERFAQYLVTDSDPSQRQAIGQALGGSSMVIQGPPGTGKSQTITNLIAAALGAGKRVLFVADKMAALEVVKNRLDDAGLGPHCLELHSTKTKKKDFLDELHRAVTSRTQVQAPGDRSEVVEAMARLERDITAYDRAMSASIGSIGMTLRDLIWSAQHVRAQIGQLPARLGEIALSDVDRLTNDDVEEDCKALKHLQDAWWRVADSEGRTHRHPWRFVTRGDLSTAGQDRLSAAVREWLRAVESIASAAAEVPGLPMEMALAELARTSSSLSRLPALGAARIDVLSRLGSKASWNAFEALVADLSELQDTQRALSGLTTNLDATAACAEQCLGLYRELKGWVVDETTTVEQVLRHVGAWRKQVAATVESGKIAQNLLRAWAAHGAPAVTTPGAARAVLAWRDCLDATPARILELRSEATIDESQLDRFVKLADEAAALRRRREGYDADYPGWSEKASGELRELALVLRTTSFLGRLFSRPYKEAVRTFLRLTTATRNASREEMARLLTELGRFADEWEHWPAKPEVKQLAGPAYRGMDTDFEGLAECSRWARRCQEKVAPLGGDARWVLSVLFRAPRDGLERAAAVLPAEHCARLRSWAGADQAVAIEEWARRTVEQIGRIELLAKVLVEAGIRPNTSICDLPRVQALTTSLATLRDRVCRNEPGIGLLGSGWVGFGTDIAPLRATLEARRGIAALALPPAVEHAALEKPEVRWGRFKETGTRIGVLLGQEQRARSLAEAAGAVVERVWGDRGVAGALDILRAAASTSEHLAEWVSFRRAWEEACRSNGPRDFLNGLDWSQIPPEQLEMVYRLAVYRGLSALAQQRFPNLNRAAWSGAQLSMQVQDHAARDAELIELQRQALRFQLARVHIPPGTVDGPRSTDLALVLHETAKKTRHQPIRLLLQQASGAVQALKPCFMMSPLSVAQYLEPGRVSFDLVIVDEASQMRPAESLGLLLRSHQVVVVGDRQQLPPTSFFDRLDRQDDEHPAEEEEGVESDNMDSILDMMLATSPPICDLRWHYRSRHESLIQFSNEQFYDGRLCVLPSPAPGRPDLGVQGRPVDGIYGQSVNRIEADTIADEAVAFMRDNPERSLGIVAMNQTQAELIRHRVDEKLRTADVKYEDKWNDTLEPFFVKNLESVQGDERDVIFVSLTYGPSGPGQKPAQRFGPINGAFGHRRLNVLFTRAKHQLRLFSSLRPDQIEVKEQSHRGVRVLKDYLQYAFGTNGVTRDAMASGRRKLHPSFQCLAHELGSYGLTIQPGIGTQNIEVPVAVHHPERAGTYACAIDFDGCAERLAYGDFRERTRTFPRLLDQLEWKRVPTWTSDWLRNPLTAQQDLVRGIEGAVGRRLVRGAVDVDPEAASPAAVGVELRGPEPSATDARSKPARGFPGAARVTVVHAGVRELEHPLIDRIRVADHFERARTSDTWERLVIPLVRALANEGGHAPLGLIAQVLGYPAFRINGVVAQVQEHLNAGQHQVLRYDREASQIQLDIRLLEQLAAS
jgi:hypothetical protein